MNYYEVGKIVNTHGIKGELKIISKTDFPEDRFKPGNILYIRDNGKINSYEIKSHRTHKQFEMITFKELENINLVENLKGKTLEISEEQQESLSDGNYYHHQIIGLDVFSEDNNYIGVIKEIMSPGANDVWVVKRKGSSDLLLPAIKDVIKKIDLEQNKVIIELLDGLD